MNLLEEMQNYRSILNESEDEFTPRSYKEENEHIKTHTTHLPLNVAEHPFEKAFSGPGKTAPNSEFTRYSNGVDKDVAGMEFIITKYDRLTNEVEIIHTGNTHLPVYFDFDNPERAQKYLDKFNIILNKGKEYIK
jgi:hypothetical protein